MNRAVWKSPVGYNEEDDSVWHWREEGPIWEGCINQAWHVELHGCSDPAQRFFATYAGGRLLLLKTDENHPDAWPWSFAAEYEYVDTPA